MQNWYFLMQRNLISSEEQTSSTCLEMRQSTSTIWNLSMKLFCRLTSKICVCSWHQSLFYVCRRQTTHYDILLTVTKFRMQMISNFWFTHAVCAGDKCYEGWRHIKDSFDDVVMKSKRRSTCRLTLFVLLLEVHFSLNVDLCKNCRRVNVLSARLTKNKVENRINSQTRNTC